MNEENLENETPINEEEVTSENTEGEDETPTLSSEEIAELRKKADLADNYKVRAEKAEKLAKSSKKEQPKEETPKETQDLSSKDVIYLAKADIHEEDMDELLSYAKKNDVDVKQAHQYLQPIFDRKAEERKTAEATNTKSPRGTSKTDGTKILADAERGKLPDAEDKESIDALTSAFLASKQVPQNTRK